MDRPGYATGQMIHYMNEERLDRFHIQQLSYMFNSAEKKNWKSFNDTLLLYNGPLNVINDKGFSLMRIAADSDQKKSISILITKGVPATYFNMLSNTNGSIENQ